MPVGMHVNRHEAPTGMPGGGTVSTVPLKATPEELRRLENRMRAHVRQRMLEFGIGTSGVEHRTGVNQSYLGRWLQGGRGSGTSGRGGISVRKLYQLVSGLGLDLFHVLTREDGLEERSWETFVPTAREEPRPSRASASTALSPRLKRRGGAH